MRNKPNFSPLSSHYYTAQKFFGKTCVCRVSIISVRFDRVSIYPGPFPNTVCDTLMLNKKQLFGINLFVLYSIGINTVPSRWCFYHSKYFLSSQTKLLGHTYLCVCLSACFVDNTTVREINISHTKITWEHLFQMYMYTTYVTIEKREPTCILSHISQRRYTISIFTIISHEWR